MKKVFYFLLILLGIFSCSPKISSKIISEYKPLAISAQVLVLNEYDDQAIKGIKIGQISSTDSGFSNNCSFKEIIEPLKNLSREKGANLIKITKHKSADSWSTCDRVFADIYRVDSVSIYEKEIFWSADRKLKWENFKGKPKIMSNNGAAAMTSCGFQLQTNRVTLFKNAKFFIDNKFDCYLSWVDSTKIPNDYLLKHEQGHFDISEIYKRKLEKKLNENRVGITNLNGFAQNAFNEVYQEFLDKQEDYDRETVHGTNKDKQEEWNSFIELSLN